MSVAVPSVWKDGYRVRIYETDAEGAVSASSLCDFCQEAATRHYYAVDRMIGPLLSPTQIWALTRLELSIDRTAGWEETLDVETWSRSIERVSAYRDFLIRNPAGMEIAKGTTTWVVLDRATGRFSRLDDFSVKWPSIPDRSVFGRDASKVPGLENAVKGSAFHVGYGDLDVNRHVNSVCYIRWMADAIGPQESSRNRVRGLAVNFLDEAMAGDEVRVDSCRPVDGTVLCAVVRVSDSRELCRAKFELVGRS
jgi:acyl-ACP thioesterase